jgi:hypothetical protein
MCPANVHAIRLATEDDGRALGRMAQFDSQRPLGGRVLIGEIDGTAAAAISLKDNRMIADPFQRTGHITEMLRMRAASFVALAKTPSLRDRMRNGVHVAGRWRRAGSAA